MNIEPQPQSKTLSETLKAEQHFRLFHKALYSDQYPDLIPFLEKHLFMITVTFRKGQVSIYEPKSTLEYPKIHPINAYSMLNFMVMKTIMGNNLQRKRQHQPLTYAWVDFDGSRNSKKNRTLECQKSTYSRRRFMSLRSTSKISDLYV